ncbi:MAG: peptidylprolyl isomerase [Chloroflexi bacterium]|nr:peptidylprolyl isomerase [Chloroflexota bacterium]
MARQRNPGIVRPSQRRHQSKLQREQSKQRALIVAGIIAVLFILAIPAYGYWSNFIAPPRSVVLQVDDAKFTLGFVTKYLKGLEALGAQVDLSVEPFLLMQQLQQDELVRSGAISKGITVDSSDVDQEVRDRIIGSSPDLIDVPPDQLDREFNEAYTQFLDTSNLSKKEHRSFVEASLLRAKLREVLGEDIPTVAKQANLSWIVISSRLSEGDEAIAQAQESVQQVSVGLQAGADFGALAEAFSEDRNTAANGGLYGWVPEGAFGTLDKDIFALEPGETSDAVSTGDFTYFFKVSEFEEEKDVEPEMMNRLKEAALQQWLFDERGNHRISSCFGSGSAGGACDWQYDWLVKQIRDSAFK